jgi:hypothetical protein
MEGFELQFVENQCFRFLFKLSTVVCVLEKSDTMGERIGRIGRIDTDFFWVRVLGIR